MMQLIKPIGDLHSVPHWRCGQCKKAIVVFENDKKPEECPWCGARILWDSKNKRMKTNADVIRSMSDGQLCDFLAALKEDDIDYAVTFCDMCMEDKKTGGYGNALDYDCDACFRSWVVGSAYDYNGLLSSGLNSGFVEVEDGRND